MIERNHQEVKTKAKVRCQCSELRPTSAFCRKSLAIVEPVLEEERNQKS